MLSVMSGFRTYPGALPVPWREDKRKFVVKLIILALINEARGLGSAQNARAALMQGSAVDRQRGLKSDLRPYEPRVLLLVGDELLFRPGEPVRERRALTCIILELPSPVESA